MILDKCLVSRSESGEGKYKCTALDPAGMEAHNAEINERQDNKELDVTMDRYKAPTFLPVRERMSLKGKAEDMGIAKMMRGCGEACPSKEPAARQTISMQSFGFGDPL